MTGLLHQRLFDNADRTPNAPALVYQSRRLHYAALAADIDAASRALLAAGLQRGARVAVYLDKRPETVAALFGASAAGAVFVPVNPLLKAEQVAHILSDCTVSMLVTSSERLQSLAPVLAHCTSLRAIFLVGGDEIFCAPTQSVQLNWAAACAGAPAATPHRRIDADIAAILYTSGSTGKPKGVVLSHRNLVAGAASVASYLGNHAADRILALLPLSFDYGLSQLTTAFHVGATAVLMNHLLPRDIPKLVQAEGITGLAAVPPLWMQLARLDWPQDCALRYLTNSGGSMPRVTLARLREILPHAQPYLMYGLTEAFRSTYLPPSQATHRPDSIGRAIPNAEVLVVRPDGSLCDDDEPGELVHRGALVSLGYWNDPQKTAERFRPAPSQEPGLPMPELAVWSGDTVRRDAEGYLYFISRDDEMIKSSGYRISPTEIEEVLYADARVTEAVAFGVAHPTLGQAVVAVVSLQASVASPGTGTGQGIGAPDGFDGGGNDSNRSSSVDTATSIDHSSDEATTALLASCRQHLPGYMLPAKILIRQAGLPRNPNGKIDRAALRAGLQTLFTDDPS